MNTKKQKELAIELANKKLTTYHYKTIFYLYGNDEITQSQIAEQLKVPKQNINRVMRDLKSMDIVKQSKVVGRNIYWKLNPSPNFQLPGQINLDDIKVK